MNCIAELVSTFPLTLVIGGVCIVILLSTFLLILVIGGSVAMLVRNLSSEIGDWWILLQYW